MSACHRIYGLLAIALATTPSGASLAADNFASVRPLLRAGVTATPPKLDGQLDDAAWRGAATVRGFTLAGGVKEATQQTEVSICYSRQALYVAFRCHEASPEKIAVAAKQRDGEVWRDDSVEVFIAPPGKGGGGYYHLVTNAIGTQYDAYCVQPKAADTRWDGDWKVATARASAGWNAEFEIPFSIYGAHSSGDRVWRMNFTREERPLQEMSTWAPVKASFHEPDRFAAIILSKRGPTVTITDWGAKPGSSGLLSAMLEDPQRQAKRMLVQLSPPGKTLASQTVGKSRELKLGYKLPAEGEMFLSAALVNASGDVLFRQTKSITIPLYQQQLHKAKAAWLVVEQKALQLPPAQSMALTAYVAAGRTASREAEQALAAWQVGDDAGRARVEEAFELLDYRTRLLQLRIGPAQLGKELSLERVGSCMVMYRLAGVRPSQYAREQGLAIWLKDPWENTSPFDLPKQLAHQASMTLRAVGGEHVSVAVMMTNLGLRCAETRISITAPAEAALPLPASAVRLRYASYVRKDDGARSTVGDALVRLNEGNLLTVPTDESRQLWLTIDTTGLEPGSYQGQLLVEPLVDYPRQLVPVTLEVLPVTLPEQAPVKIFTWGATLNISWAKPDPMAYLRDAAEYGVNVFLVSPASIKAKFDAKGNMIGMPDYTEHDKLVKAYAPYGMIMGCYSIGDHFDKLSQAAGIAYMSPAYRKAFRTWITDWIAHLQALGLTYDDFAFELYDEPSGGIKYEHHLGLGKLLKEIDPKARVVITANFYDLTKLEEINPTVDIWVPHVGVLRNDAAREFMKKTGKEMWCYACSGSGKQLSPINYYRLLPWEARKYSLRGWGYFAHMWWGEDPWQVTNTTHKRGAHYSTIYPGSDGPIPSRRWEAYRRGLEDYKLLLVLDQAIAQAQAAGKPPELIAQARTLAEQAPDRALQLRGDSSAIWIGSDRPGQGTELEALRDEIADMIMGLR